MPHDAFTRRELVGGGLQSALWVTGILGSVALMLYGILGCQWLDPRDPDFVRLLAGAYGLGLALLLARRKRFFPWWRRAPALGVASLVAMAVPFGFLAVGAVLVANAHLDRGQPITRQYVIVRKTDPADSVLVPISPGGPQEVELHVGGKGIGFARGNVIELTIKPGLFRKPWIKDYRFVREFQ